jgi:hypothetical protein
MMDSARNIGMQRKTAEKRYTRMKAAPPFCPTMYGKRQMLPRPMAEPAMAMIAVNRLLKLPLSFIYA